MSFLRWLASFFRSSQGIGDQFPPFDGGLAGGEK